VILHLGVADLPYNQAQPPPRKGRRRRKTSASTVTTGDVAEFLENRYHIMEIFFQERQADIAGYLENSLEGALENVLLGAPPSNDPFGTATSEIEDRFKMFLSNKEMEALGYPGVPTQAALKGVNHRLKLRKGPRRPSFIDTGLYQASFHAWID
jgi:hypothetical protein